MESQDRMPERDDWDNREPYINRYTERFPCGCRPCPDCGAAACSLGRGGCANEVHGVIVNL